MLHLTNKKQVYQSDKRAGFSLLTVLFCCSLAAPAQNTTYTADKGAVFSIRATHLLGFENAKNNCTGTFVIRDGLLQFQQNAHSVAQVKIGSVRDVLLGEESKQVGGLPMTLGKAAAPFGSGRVVSLVARKKYDILTLEYVDGVGGIHGAIFQLQKDQAAVVKAEIVGRGVSISSHQGEATSPIVEVRHENK